MNASPLPKPAHSATPSRPTSSSRLKRSAPSPPTDGVIYRRAVSKSNALPELPGETVTDLALIEAFEQIEPHASNIAGAWPQVSDAEHYEVAISEPAAAVPGVIVIYPRISLEPAVTAVLVLTIGRHDDRPAGHRARHAAAD